MSDKAVSIDSDETETPPEVFRRLAAKYAPGGFDLDAFAAHDNALVDVYYTADGYWLREASPQPDDPPDAATVDVTRLGDRDGLTGSWGTNTAVFANPPYSSGFPAHAVAKAWAEMARPDGPHTIVMLLPARTDSRWWREHVEPYRDGRDPGAAGVTLTTDFSLGRVEFLRNGQRIPLTKKCLDGRRVVVTKKRDGSPRLSSVRFGVVVLVWRRATKNNGR